MKKLLFIAIVLCLFSNIWGQTTKNITFTSVLTDESYSWINKTARSRPNVNATIVPRLP